MTHESSASLIAIAGALHFLQLPSMAYLRRGALHLEADLARLTPINARLVRLFVLAVMGLLLGLGGSAVTQSDAWVATPLGRYLTWLLACFWLGRAGSQLWLQRVWPAGRANRAIYFLLLALYAFLAASYLLVATSAAASAPQRIPMLT